MANKPQNALQTRVNNGADTPQCRARLTLAASSCPKSFDIGAARVACKISANFSFCFWHCNCTDVRVYGRGVLLQFVTVPTGLPASPSAATCGRKKSPNIRSWHSALLESESCTKKTKHEEGTQTKKKNNRIKFSSASTWPNATWHRQHQLAMLSDAARRCCFWPCSMCDRVLISCCIKGLFLFSLSAACGHATCIVCPSSDASSSSSSPLLSSSHCCCLAKMLKRIS